MKNEITPLIAAETIAVLENTEITLLAKIPSKLIEALQEKADELGRKVNLDYTKSYKEQNLSEETRVILTLFYRDYWCTKEQKEEINRIMQENEERYQRELREKYNSDKIFEQKTAIKTISNPLTKNYAGEIMKDETKEVSLVKVEEMKWYQKIFCKIRSIFFK